MKGFEVRFRGETVRIAIDEPMVISVIANKRHGKLDLNVGGLMIDTDTHPVWMQVDDLKEGDEIIIERKEVEQSSTPLSPPPNYDPNRTLTPEEKREFYQYKLQYFRKIENIGYIDMGMDSDISRIPYIPV